MLYLSILAAAAAAAADDDDDDDDDGVDHSADGGCNNEG